MIFSLLSKFAQRTQKYARFDSFFSLKISLKDMDVYAWTFHWTCCRFSKSVVKFKKKKKKKKSQIFKMTEKSLNQ